MNKKIILISVVIVFILIIAAFASTVTSDTSKPIRKESPLFGIRTKRAIREKIKDLIKARFIGERTFFLPFQWLRNRDILPERQRLQDKTALECLRSWIEGCYTAIFLSCRTFCPDTEDELCTKFCAI